MTVPYAWIVCYVREKEELRDQEKILQFFQKLTRHGCLVTSLSDIGTATIWRRFGAEIPLKHLNEEERAFASALEPSVSTQVIREVRVYVAELQEQLTVDARLIAQAALLRGFTFSVTLAPADGTILLTVEHERFFQRGPAGTMKFRYWIKLLQEIYAYWHPLFMHEFNHFASINPSWDEVQAGAIPTLFSLNAYGPALVQKLGREKLTQAPAWLQEDLDDEGVLLIPTDMYGLTPEKSHDFNAVASYLGFPTENVFSSHNKQEES